MKRSILKYMERAILGLIVLNLMISIVEVSQDKPAVLANKMEIQDTAIDSTGTNSVTP
jgi:hypothetical protein